MMLWKCCTQYASKLGKFSSGHRTGKGRFSFQSQRRAMPKNAQSTACISHASKVMLKILQSRLQQYVSQELPDVKMGLSKSRGTRIKLPTCTGSLRKQGEFQKNIYFCLIDYTKAFDCVYHNKLENSWRDGNTRPPYLSPKKRVCRSRSNS